MTALRTLCCLVLATVLVGKVLTSCSQRKGPAPDDGKLTIGTLYTPDVLPLVVAKEQGLFSDEGIDVELLPFQSAMERDSTFVARESDGMTGDLVGTSLMRARGLDLRVVVMTVGDRSGVGRFAILAAPTSDLKTPMDLKGRPIAMSTNTLVEFVADELLAQYGFTDDDIRKSVVAKIPVRLNMLIEGMVPAAILPDPLAAYAEMKGARVLVDDTHDNLGQAVIAFNKKVIDGKPGTLKRFVRAYNRAVDLINADTSAFEAKLSQITRTPAGVEGYHVISYPRNALPSPLHVRRVHRWIMRKGLIKEEPAYDEIVTDAFVEPAISSG